MPYPANWDTLRKEVYERDGHECQNCGASDIEIHAHHTVPLSSGGSNEMSNLITLCEPCHLASHGRGVAPTAVREYKLDDFLEMDMPECPDCGGEFGSTSTDTIECRDCHVVIQFDRHYIPPELLDDFDRCEKWLCRSTVFELTADFEEGTGRMECAECKTRYEVDMETGDYHRQSRSILG